METNTKLIMGALKLVTLGAFALTSLAQAVIPAPDGAYPGGNTAEGQAALLSLTTGSYNTAVGFLSLRTDTTANFNTATGAGTLLANTADRNTATGAAALLSNTIGEDNTANGAFALLNNIDGNNNTATGAGALFSNTTTDFNTANGVDSLHDNVAGNGNTAIGFRALFHNTAGEDNTATGYVALYSNDAGVSNTASGAFALSVNTTGSANTAIGTDALQHNISGNANTALGSNAGSGVTIASNVICIGNEVAGADVNDSCYIGNIWNQPGGSQAVYVNSDGKLGAQVSSRRFKDDIKPMREDSKALYELTPVTFRYKKKVDPAGTSQFGLVAEDVEAVNPDLVVRDKDGNPYSVRYDQVNAMLLNEFLKEHKKVEQQAATITELRATIVRQQKSVESKLAEQEKQISALASGLQKVSAQIEINKASRRTALNDH